MTKRAMSLRRYKLKPKFARVLLPAGAPAACVRAGACHLPWFQHL